MKKQTKLRLAWWIGFPLVLIALRIAGGGRVWDYMVDHLWLCCVLPLAMVFVILFVQTMYVSYRKGQEVRSKMGGAQGTKL